MWALWLQLMDRSWGIVLWLRIDGHWLIVALLLGLVLSFIVFKKHRD